MQTACVELDIACPRPMLRQFSPDCFQRNHRYEFTTDKLNLLFKAQRPDTGIIEKYGALKPGYLWLTNTGYIS